MRKEKRKKKEGEPFSFCIPASRMKPTACLKITREKGEKKKKRGKKKNIGSGS